MVCNSFFTVGSTQTIIRTYPVNAIPQAELQTPYLGNP